MAPKVAQDSETSLTTQSPVIRRLIEEGINGSLDSLSVKPVILSPKECSLSYAPAREKLPLGVDLLDSVLFTIPKNQIEFVAWQIPIVISTELPTGRVLASAAHSAALFCCQAQAHGLVPMIDLRLSVLEYNQALSTKGNSGHHGGSVRVFLASEGPHFVSDEIKQPCVTRRWRAISPSCFRIVSKPPNFLATLNDEEEIRHCQDLAQELSAVLTRILASMTEMSVDFKNLVIGVGVDIEASGDVVRTGAVESLLVANMAQNCALAELGALCLILPPCQASNQKTLVERARLVSPYPVLFAQLRESIYSSAKSGRASSYHQLAPNKVLHSSEANSLLAAGC